MTEREFNELREANWRRPLDPAEDARVQAWLALHPDAQAKWEADASLNLMLDQLPAAPVPSNFTAQVLRAVEHAPVRSSWMTPGAGRWRRWLQPSVPRWAWALALAVVSFFGYQRYTGYQQEQLARGLVQFTRASGLEEPGLFQDYEVIRRLGQLPAPADEELWLALNLAPAE